MKVTHDKSSVSIKSKLIITIESPDEVAMLAALLHSTGDLTKLINKHVEMYGRKTPFTVDQVKEMADTIYRAL